MSNVVGTGINTKNLSSSSFVVATAMNIKQLTLIVQSGTLNVTGQQQFPGGTTNDVVSLATGTTLTIPASEGSVLNGITFESVGGVTAFVFQF